MGSTGLEGHGTHAEIDAYCMRPFWSGGEGQGDHYTFSDCRLVGFSHHWFVRRINGAPVSIEIAIIERKKAKADRNKTGAWGEDGAWYVREHGEEAGPYLYDCPLDLLEMVPCPDSDNARRWREKVRAYHAEKAATPRLTVGTRFKLRDGLSIGKAQIGGAIGVVTRFRKRTAVAKIEGFYGEVTIRAAVIAEILSA